jgi:hypothetical protein
VTSPPPPPLSDHELALQKLTARELSAYRLMVDTNQPNLAPTKQAQLFELFLSGVEPLEIVSLNPGISLGQVTRVRIEGLWDKRRQDYRDSLLFKTQERLEQTLMECYSFVSLQLTVAHKLHAKKLQRYIQTGDEGELGGWTITGWRSYQDAIGILKQLGTKTDNGPDAKQVMKTVAEPPPPPLPENVKTVDAPKVIAKVVEVRRAQQEQDRKKKW